MCIDCIRFFKNNTGIQLFRQRCVLRVCLAKNKKMRLKNQKEQCNITNTENSEVRKIALVSSGVKDQSIDVIDNREDEAGEVSYVSSGMEEQAIDAIDNIEYNGDRIDHINDVELNIVTCVKVVQLYECSKCGKKFSKKPYALKHCEEKPSWKCPNCGLIIQYKLTGKGTYKTARY